MEEIADWDVRSGFGGYGDYLRALAHDMTFPVRVKPTELDGEWPVDPSNVPYNARFFDSLMTMDSDLLDRIASERRRRAGANKRAHAESVARLRERLEAALTEVVVEASINEEGEA